MPTAPSKTGDQSRYERMMIYLCVVIWVAHGVIVAGRAMFLGYTSDPGSMLARGCTTATGVIITLAMLALLRRYRGGGILDEFRRAALASLVACALQTGLNETFFKLFSAYYEVRPQLYLSPSEFIPSYFGFLWIFMAWAALYAALVGSESLRLQDRAMADARDAEQQARLAALRYQIQPHFLFNALNAISGLIGEGRAREADEALLRLAAFYRHTLAAAPREFVTLAAEVDAQRLYLSIEEVRFSDRLKTSIVVDPETEGALVPSLILQPFVENAIKHGLACSAGTTAVEIRADREGGRLKLTICDDARAESIPAVTGLGRSLQNVRQRLDMIYDGDFDLTYGPRAEGGWLVTLSLPFDVEATA